MQFSIYIRTEQRKHTVTVVYNTQISPIKGPATQFFVLQKFYHVILSKYNCLYCCCCWCSFSDALPLFRCDFFLFLLSYSKSAQWLLNTFFSLSFCEKFLDHTTTLDDNQYRIEMGSVWRHKNGLNLLVISLMRHGYQKIAWWLSGCKTIGSVSVTADPSKCFIML